jgi:hypothetical protein
LNQQQVKQLSELNWLKEFSYSISWFCYQRKYSKSFLIFKWWLSKTIWWIFFNCCLSNCVIFSTTPYFCCCRNIKNTNYFFVLKLTRLICISVHFRMTESYEICSN